MIPSSPSFRLISPKVLSCLGVAALALAAGVQPAAAQCPVATNLGADAHACSVRLTWGTSVGALPFGSWEVYRNTVNSTSGATLVGFTAPNQPGFDDTPPLRNTDYYYFVRAGQTFPGSCPSGAPYSSIVAGHMLDVQTPNLTHSEGCVGVTINWSATFPEATGYEIRRRHNGVTTVLGELGSGGHAWGDVSGVPGLTYEYFVAPILPCEYDDSTLTGFQVVFPGTPIAAPNGVVPGAQIHNPGDFAGLDFNLPCNPSTLVTRQFFKDGVQIVPLNGSRLQMVDAKINITDVRPSDTGVYRCTLITLCGTVSQEIALGVRSGCPADFNSSGSVTVQDIFDFLAAYFAGCP